MTKFFLIIAMLLSTLLSAQSDYETLMENALLETKFETLNEKLQIVSEKYPDQWLPNYYLAYYAINNSFLNLKNETVLKEDLKKAQSFLDKAYGIKNDKAELLVLQAKLYLVYVISNNEKYGRSYAPIISKLNNDAFSLAPNNPRVILNKAQWEIGMAKYFGTGTASFCIDLEMALDKYETFVVKEKFAPSWGLDETKKALNSCKEINK